MPLINDDPTLDAISDLTIEEDAPQQTVYLTGISDGDGHSLPLKVTATTSRTFVVTVNPAGDTTPVHDDQL